MRVVIATVLLLAGAPAESQPLGGTLAPGEILLQVEADGEYQSRPDVMTIAAGAFSTGRTVAQAMAANTILSSRLIEAVRAQGVAASDVQTQRLNVDAKTDDEAAQRQAREPRIIGYSVRNTVRLRIRNINRAAEIMDALFKAGANDVDGPTFSLADSKGAEREARRAATIRARQKAEEYADAYGLRIGRMMGASERAGYTDRAGTMVITGSRLTPIEPGNVTTKVELWVDYALVAR